MRWPWQKREPDPVEDEIAEQMVEHEDTLKHVGRVLFETRDDISRTARIMDEYARADERRQL